MKSNTLHFSPTSAGVRIDHLNLQNSSSDKNNSISSNNCCNNIINCNNKDNFSLPRARVSPQASQDEGEFKHFLEQIVIRNHPSCGSVPDKTDKNCQHPTRLRQKPNNKMRNCLLIAGAAVILSLLSFVFLVECRSIKGGTHSKKNYDVEISSESRIQDTSIQEPDPESSEEYPRKVASTTSTSKDAISAFSSSSTPVSSTTKSSSSTTKRTSGTSPTSSGRLTRSRVSVICKGGHFGVVEEDLKDLNTKSTTSTSPSSTKKSHNKYPVNFYNNPILHRVSDDDDDDEEEEEDKGGEKTDWGDDDDDDDENAALSQEESQHKVITVTGYSHVAGGKPETKALAKSGSNTAIKYVPKPSQNDSVAEEDSEASSSSEEEEVVTLKPKTKSGDHGKHQKSKPKARPVSHKSHTTPVSSTTTETPTSTTSKSSSHKKSKHTQPPRNKRESSEESDEEDWVITPAPRTSKNSSKNSSKKGSKRSKSKDNPTTTTTTAPKNQKGDSGELEDEEESLLPTLRKSKSESKREKGRKALERRQKAPAVIQLVENPDLESAEAEPESVTTEAARKIESSSSRKSSRSKRPKSSDVTSSKKETSSSKPLAAKEDSSSLEEYNMEEMPFSAPSQQDSGSTKKKSRRSNSNGSKSSRMTSRTAAPKQRTGTFSSDETD